MATFNKIKQELARNVVKQSISNSKYFIMKDGEKIGFRTLKEAKANRINNEQIFTLLVGYNSKIYTQKVHW